MSARILVADDIEANRRLLRAKLEAQLHMVFDAANGLEAYEVARREKPEIILLDVMMPVMDGYETCRRLKADPVTAHIPVVMVTALSDVEDRVRGLEAGAEDFITKPVDDFQLTSRIQALSRYNAVACELRLRQAQGVAAGALDENEATELNRPVRVLVMDQRNRHADRLARILRNAGHHVVTYGESQGGTSIAGGIDLIVLSLSGQSFDPLKVCSHFRVSETTRPISIIVSADRDETRQAAQALAYGASDVIQMPVDPQELLARVRTQARRTRYIEIMRRRVDRGVELSVIDQLTGLYNRRYMMGQLHQWMGRAMRGDQPLSVIALDIDHFKKVNDTFGHAAGDDVLQQMAERLRANVRPIDIVCRPGGEEFIVILPETGGDRACQAAERIRQAVAEEPFQVTERRSIDITLSAGVAMLAGLEDTPASLLGRADQALYAAKTEGRNRVCSRAA